MSNSCHKEKVRSPKRSEIISRINKQSTLLKDAKIKIKVLECQLATKQDIIEFQELKYDQLYQLYSEHILIEHNIKRTPARRNLKRKRNKSTPISRKRLKTRADDKMVL